MFCYGSINGNEVLLLLRTTFGLFVFILSLFGFIFVDLELKCYDTLFCIQ